MSGSLAIDKKVLGEVHPLTGRALNNLACNFGACKAWPEAADAIDESRRVVARHQAKILPGLAQAGQLRFLQTSDTGNFHS